MLTMKISYNTFPSATSSFRMALTPVAVSSCTGKDNSISFLNLLGFDHLDFLR